MVFLVQLASVPLNASSSGPSGHARGYGDSSGRDIEKVKTNLSSRTTNAFVNFRIFVTVCINGYLTVSRRIVVFACRVVDPKYIGDGNQLTLLNGTDTVTVTAPP